MKHALPLALVALFSLTSCGTRQGGKAMPKELTGPTRLPSRPSPGYGCPTAASWGYFTQKYASTGLTPLQYSPAVMK